MIVFSVPLCEYIFHLNGFDYQSRQFLYYHIVYRFCFSFLYRMEIIFGKFVFPEWKRLGDIIILSRPYTFSNRPKLVFLYTVDGGAEMQTKVSVFNFSNRKIRFFSKRIEAKVQQDNNVGMEKNVLRQKRLELKLIVNKNKETISLTLLFRLLLVSTSQLFL